MELLYFSVAILCLIISIIMIVKFFQIANDIRSLKNHFIPPSSSVNNITVEHIDNDEVITGIIRKNGGINYTVLNGSVKFSDGKEGFIKCCDDDIYKVNGMADISFYDIYNAVEALYDNLSGGYK